MVRAAGSPRLTLAHERLVDELRLLLSPGRHYVDAGQMARSHRDLFEAIRSADIDVAMAAIRHHLELGAQRIIAHLSGEVETQSGTSKSYGSTHSNSQNRTTPMVCSP